MTVFELIEFVAACVVIVAAVIVLIWLAYRLRYGDTIKNLRADIQFLSADLYEERAKTAKLEKELRELKPSKPTEFVFGANADAESGLKDWDDV